MAESQQLRRKRQKIIGEKIINVDEKLSNIEENSAMKLRFEELKISGIKRKSLNQIKT